MTSAVQLAVGRAEAENANAVALRLCQAEVQAVLEKYGMQIGVKRVETQLGGQIKVEYLLMFGPRTPKV
jgi:hypothetical protein